MDDPFLCCLTVISFSYQDVIFDAFGLRYENRHVKLLGLVNKCTQVIKFSTKNRLWFKLACSLPSDFTFFLVDYKF